MGSIFWAGFNSTLVRLRRQPVVLDDGTIIAAAGTPGSAREVEGLSERDRRRHVAPGALAVTSDAGAAAPATTMLGAAPEQSEEKRRVK